MDRGSLPNKYGNKYLKVGFRLEVGDGLVLVGPGPESQEAAGGLFFGEGRLLVLVVDAVDVELLDQPVERLGRHLGPHVPVEGGRPAALLHVTQDVHPRREDALALFLVKPGGKKQGKVLW